MENEKKSGIYKFLVDNFFLLFSETDSKVSYVKNVYKKFVYHPTTC